MTITLSLLRRSNVLKLDAPDPNSRNIPRVLNIRQGVRVQQHHISPHPWLYNPPIRMAMCDGRKRSSTPQRLCRGKSYLHQILQFTVKCRPKRKGDICGCKDTHRIRTGDERTLACRRALAFSWAFVKFPLVELTPSNCWIPGDIKAFFKMVKVGVTNWSCMRICWIISEGRRAS